MVPGHPLRNSRHSIDRLRADSYRSVIPGSGLRRTAGAGISQPARERTSCEARIEEIESTVRERGKFDHRRSVEG